MPGIACDGCVASVDWLSGYWRRGDVYTCGQVDAVVHCAHAPDCAWGKLNHSFDTREGFFEKHEAFSSTITTQGSCWTRPIAPTPRLAGYSHCGVETNRVEGRPSPRPSYG